MSLPPSNDDRFYKATTLWKWFGISSAVMLVLTIAMILADYGREWKAIQAKGMNLQEKKFTDWIAEAKEEVDEEEINEIREKIKAAEANLESKQEMVKNTEKELTVLLTQENILDSRWRGAKAKWDVDKYHHEHKYAHYFAEGHTTEQLVGKAKESDQQLRDQLQAAYDIRDKYNDIQGQREAKEAELDAYYAENKQLERDLAEARGELGRLEEGKANAQITLTKVVRSTPILDLADPVFKPRQIVLPHIRDDYYFAMPQKVDRCTTCHVFIDKEGYENEKQPYKTHSNLKVIFGTTHPIETIGCTVCHEGRGRAMDFTRAAHTPQDKAQEKEWIKNHKWHSMHHVPEKMLPLQYTAGRCVTCHKNTEFVPKGGDVNESILTVRSAGCFGCHRIEGWDHLRKPGPSLKKIKGKVSEGWLVKWIRNPQSFNARARMPKVFHLSNMKGEKFQKYQDAELYATVSYLNHVSEEYKPNYRTALGNKDRGKALFGSVGCLGCHQIDDFAIEGKSRYGRGPDLSTVGSKVSKDWLTTWLKNPNHYWKDTTMPSLRLTNREIGDLTAYLLSKKNTDFENIEAGAANEEMQKEVLRLYLNRDPKLAPVTKAKVDAELAKLSSHEVSVELGRRTIGKYGCYGCHDIKGFEGVQGIGAELSDWGVKMVKKLDFGYHHEIGHTRHDWLNHKLDQPRSFDDGLVKEYLDTLRMPKFTLSERDRTNIVRLILGQTPAKYGAPAEVVLDSRTGKIEAGYRVMHKYNCQGCHVLEGWYVPLADDHDDFEDYEAAHKYLTEGQILAHYEEDETLGPPYLLGEGAKVKSPWIHSFLKKPFPLRKALKVRMPTFKMTNEELNKITEAWANEGNVEFPYIEKKTVRLSGKRLVDARRLFNKLQCLNCHVAGTKLTAEQLTEGSRGLAVDFWLSHERLHKDWIVKFLENPGKMLPGTRMPGFWPEGQSAVPDILGGDAKKQQELLADYLYYLGQKRLNR